MVVAAGLLTAMAGAAAAEDAQPAAIHTFTYSYERMAFDTADTNGDGLVSEAELARDAAVGFAELDKDGSGTLTPAELGPHDAAAFQRVDTNRDGVLSFEEVMTNKVRAFKAGDKNHDGGLSFDEMVEIVIEESGP